jgi:phosphoglycolate phosphatase-like HAD superfamily hydrolase
MTKPYDAVLLDIDGTLVDSNDAHASAWVDAFAAHGRDLPFDRVRPLIGMGSDKMLAVAASLDHESAEGLAIASTRAAIFKRDYVPSLRPTPGAERFVAWLLETGLRVIVATSAQEQELRDLLAVSGALALLDDATTSDDAEASKPDPDIIIAALRKARCPIERVVMVGDTPYDIEAAHRAGVVTIAFRCGGSTDDRLSGALAIYDSPADLLENLENSPFAGRRI